VINAHGRPAPGKAFHKIVFALLAAALLGGCSGFLYGQTGTVMSGYATDHMGPYLLATDDIGLACRTGGAFGTFMSSFERVSDRPDLAALIANVGAGMCAEAQAWEADLAYEGAVRAGRADEAKDAQLRSERAHLVAAKRFGAAFARAESAFGKLGGECPEIDEENEIQLLLGLSSGLMAVMHDRAARGGAGISMAIPRTVERTAKCLDNGKWFGVPNAMAAVVWGTVPGSAPKGTNPADVLTKSVAIGDKAGLRLSRAMQVLFLASSGDEAKTRAAIVGFGKALESKKAHKQYRLLDSYAMTMVRHQSDLIWMREKGYRGPTGELGPLPEKPVDDSDDADLLEDVGE